MMYLDWWLQFNNRLLLVSVSSPERLVKPIKKKTYMILRFDNVHIISLRGGIID